MPAVLVEVGYLSNSAEERLLRSDDYRQAIAHGLADGLIEYTSYY
jgi:N-acetylmuramoyl-L-alanine amidase